MTTVQEVSAVASGAKVHEFTTDLVVQRRHAAADGVVALDLVDPQGGDLPAWEPGAHIDLLLTEGLVRQYSLCGDPRDPKVDLQPLHLAICFLPNKPARAAFHGRIESSPNARGPAAGL